MDSVSAKGGKMVESDEQPERRDGGGGAMAALQQCELIQNMIDISISSLQGLRTKCAASNDLTQQEIRTLERQHFLCCYWTMNSPALLHHDPSLAYLEQYQLGFQQFSVLFSLLEPWAFCTSKSTLSLWVFRLIDENQDGLINFKEFCCALDTFYSGSFTNKLKFLFKLHLPPGSPLHLKEQRLQEFIPLTEDSSPFSKLSAFDLPEDGVIRKSPERGRGKVDLQTYLKQWQNEILRKEETIKDLPRINQSQFIQFSKTLYNIFHGDPEEETLYRAVAHVTSLLLKMEEVGRRLQEPSSPPEATKPARTTTPAAVEESSTTEEASTTPESSDTCSSHGNQEAAPDLTHTEWSFSFEQVLASLLNEPTIVSFFERPVDIQTKLGKARAAQLKLAASK